MGKFFNEHSARCTRCGTYLKSLGLARNENHLYPIGTLYGCRCGASKVWTNSIRNEAALLAHYATGSRYYQGFCNDLFDGEGGEIVPWRSVDFPGEWQRGQVYGTYAGYKRFEEGQGPDSTLVVWSGRFSPEIEGTQELVAEYAKYAEEVKRLVSTRKNPYDFDLDYDPSADYDVVEPPKWASVVNNVLANTKDLLELLDLRSPVIYYADFKDGHLAKYVDGTSSKPVIVFSVQLEKQAKKQRVGLLDAIEGTLYHELGHAFVDSSGMREELSEEDEEEMVEEFARTCGRGDPEFAVKMLRNALG